MPNGTSLPILTPVANYGSDLVDLPDDGWLYKRRGGSGSWTELRLTHNSVFQTALSRVYLDLQSGKIVYCPVNMLFNGHARSDKRVTTPDNKKRNKEGVRAKLLDQMRAEEKWLKQAN
jgi:hypothetical protein